MHHKVMHTTSNQSNSQALHIIHEFHAKQKSIVKSMTQNHKHIT